MRIEISSDLRLDITYDEEAGFLFLANDIKAEMEYKFDELAEVTVTKGDSKQFTITLDGVMLFDRGRSKRFPIEGEIEDYVASYIQTIDDLNEELNK